jgi:hypothetical protein
VQGGYDPVLKMHDHGMAQGAVPPTSCAVTE